MAKISVVINTLNEEANIAKALSSVKTFANEIILCDMDSDDRTVEIAKEFGVKIYTHKRVDYVEPARNYAISQATNEWILVLDADERIPKTLSSTLKQIVKNPKADYYRLPRKNIVFGKWLKHSRWWPDYNIRFFKKGSVSWNEVIHSVPVTFGVGKDLPDIVENAITHFHYVSVDQYLTRMNRYTSIQAKNKRREGYVFTWMDLVQKPAGEFFSRYYFGEGYKDGLHGLALALLQSFSELVLYLKLWQSEKFTKVRIDPEEFGKALKHAESDLHYWQADTLVKTKRSFIAKIKRKFRLL